MTSLDPSFINCNTLEKEGEKKAEAETENMIHLYTGLATILKQDKKLLSQYCSLPKSISCANSRCFWIAFILSSFPDVHNITFQYIPNK